MFITSNGVLSKGILPAALVPYEDLRKKITTLKLGDKKCSIPYDHSSLLYSLPLVRNVFSNPHRLLITMEVPVYSCEPIHDAYKAIPLPQPIKNTTTAATLKLERNYLIISWREESYAEMKSEEYLSCLGTQLLIIWTMPVALVSAQDQFCLTSLLPMQSRGRCFEDLHARSNRIANFTDSNLPWELYVPPQRGRRSTISL